METSTETETKDAKIFTWAVGILMVILIVYGVLNLAGIVK